MSGRSDARDGNSEGQSMKMPPTGVIPPMTTPFRKDGEIDFKLVDPHDYRL